MPEPDPAFVKQETTAKTETQHPGDDPASDEAQRTTAVTKVETPPPTQSWQAQSAIALATVVIGLLFLAFVAIRPVYDREVTLIVVPIVGAYLAAIFNYYFGSSIGSARKSEAIAKLTNGGH